MFFRRLFVVLFALTACSPQTERAKPVAADDFGDTIRVGAAPQRIVSLNPTTTELLFALGAGKRIVGRTSWDLFPVEARNVPDMGPGLRPNMEAVLGAHPDLVILYASNDNRASTQRLRAAGINTLSFKIDSIAQFKRAAAILGMVLRDSVRAATVLDSVTRSLETVRTATASLTRPRVFWHVWDAPPITIGAGSYMNELTQIAGATNVYGDLPDASPTVSIEDIVKRNPDFMLAGPEGAASMRRDARWQQVPAVRAGRILVLDTMLVARPGVRLGEAAWSLARMLHPAELK